MNPGPLPDSILDTVLTRQLAVAWAGEDGESPRLGWWTTDLINRDGGEDVFAEFAPRTHRWAAFRSVREAARRVDARTRSRLHAPDALLTLFHLGFVIDERLDDRLAVLASRTDSAEEGLPGLRDVFTDRHTFDRQRFADWLSGHGPSAHNVEPGGRHLEIGTVEPSALSGRLDGLTANLVGALDVDAAAYPMPFIRLDKGAS